MITHFTTYIDISEIHHDQDEYQHNIPISEILEEIEIENLIEYHGKDKLLEGLGYAEDMCFKTDIELKEAVEENPEVYDIELKTKLDSMNDQDIYDRFTTLLYTNKLTYQEWDEILNKYE